MKYLARKSSPARTFTIVGVLSEVPLWSFFLVGVVWWVEDLSLSPARLIFLGTALEAAVFVSEVPTGIVADRFSRRWSVQISFVLIGLGLLLHAATTNYAVLLGSLLLVGFGWTFRSGADIAWLSDQFDGADEDSETLSPVIVRRQIVVLLANVVTVPATVLLGMWSLRGTIAIFGGVALVGGLVVAPLLDGIGNADNDLSFREIATQGRRVVTGLPIVRRVVIVAFLVSLGSPAVDWLGLERFLVRGDFDDQSLPFMGGLFVVIAIAAAVTVWGVEHRLAGGAAYRSLAGGLLLVTALGAAMITLTPVLLVGMGLLLHDMMFEAMQPVVSAWVNPHTDESSRATVHSLVGQAGSFGEFSGGVLAAAVAATAGVNAALVLSAAIVVVAAALAGTTPKTNSPVT